MKYKLICLFILFLSRLGFSQSYYSPNKMYNDKNAGIVLTVAGVTFTAAALLQGGYDYGTWQTTTKPGNIQVNTYVKPPFMKQTPRQIMFFTGISLTFVGIFHYTTH